MRRWLVIFLALAAAVLSFDALRAHALASGVIPEQAILPHAWLAALWAVVIDAAAAAGILGVRQHRNDWRAWLMLVLAFAASVGFQVWTPPTALARAVPPVVLALAIIVLELPRARSLPTVLAGPGGSTAAVTTEAGSTSVPPRPRPVAAVPRSRGKLPEVVKEHAVALDRAKKNPAEVERVMVRLGLDRSVVEARPERWPLPSENGTPR